MTLPLPDPYITEGEWDGVQRNFDRLASLFPLTATAATFGQVPQVRAFHNAAQSIPTAVVTAIAFNSDRYALGTSPAMHDTAVNNSRLTCRVPGLHSIAASVEWAAGTGDRAIQIRLNGATVIAAQGSPATAALGEQQTVDTQWRMVAGDYVELVGFQNSGGALAINSAASYSPEFMMHWVSP